MEEFKFTTIKPSNVIVPEKEPALEELNATNNGEYLPTGENVGFSKVTVNLPLGEKTITQNGEYLASGDSYKGFSKVTVNVQGEKPTLNEATLSDGSASLPLKANTNSRNGAFPNKIICTIGGNSAEFDLNISSAVNVVPWIYSITPLEGGTFNVSVELGGTGFNNSAPVTASKTMPAATLTTGYYSVNNLGSSAVTSVTYTYDSDFPRTFQEVEDTYGNKFIKIPTIYRKVLASSDGQITGYALATSALDQDYVPYPCFVDETNSNAVLPYVLFGKYCVSSSDAANSIKSDPFLMTVANGRTLCRNRGTGYQQYDWKFQKLFVDLGVALSHYVNINNGYNVNVIMGITHQDKNTWVDGVVKGSDEDGQQWYIGLREQDYQNAGGGTSNSTSASEATILANGYVKISYKSPNATNFIAKLGYDTSYPFFNYPETGGASNSTYYCDQFYFSSGSRPVYCSVGSEGTASGWFYCDASRYWNDTRPIRLCYRPILNATGYTEA